MKRVLTAVALLPLAAIAILAPLWVFAALCVAGMLLGLREFFRMTERAGVPPLRWSGLLAGLGALLPGLFGEEVLGYGALVVLALAAFVIEAIVRRIPADRAAHSIAWGLLGVSLLGAFLDSQLLLRRTGGPEDPRAGGLLLLFLYATVFAGDTAAFYLGTRFGRHRLAPEISPGKSWEGLAAGLLASGLVALAAGPGLLPGVPAAFALGAGIALGIAAVLGDLFESLLKRTAGMKDSGGSLPGHGGLWDRFDSLILSSPLMLLLTELLLPGTLP